MPQIVSGNRSHPRRYTEYWDAYGFLIQLGALPAPAAAPAATPTP